MSAQRRLSHFVKSAEPVGLDSEWEAVNRRVRRRRVQRVVTPVLAVLLVGGLAAGGVWQARRPELLEAGQLAEASSLARTVRLADDSRLTIAAGGALRVDEATDDDVLVFVERGSSEFSVPKKKGRHFTVRAGDVEVRVVGTVFRVSRAAETVTVEVDEGVVEVHQGERVVRVGRQEQWVSPRPPAPLEPSDDEPEALPLEREAAAHLDDEGGLFDEDGEQPQATDPERRLKRRAVKGPRRQATEQEPSPAAPSGMLPDSGVAAAPELNPADLFRDAMRDRNEGAVRRAMAGFQLVCERFPSSAFAPMSAFEWGRLAMDVERDPRLAARAFERALELAKAPSLVEDTLARLAEAYSRFDLPACRRVSSEYLRRFPTGPHVTGVKKACPE